MRVARISVAIAATLSVCLAAAPLGAWAGSADAAAAAPVATLLPDGTAVPPAGAPRPVRRAIRAANRIHTRPYVYGGGHWRWRSRGYDCSGSVGFVLHAAGLLHAPKTSGGFARAWGRPGPGRWITVYANGRHAYAVIAGLRWDTSSVADPFAVGSGPRWRVYPRGPRAFRVRHPRNY